MGMHLDGRTGRQADRLVCTPPVLLCCVPNADTYWQVVTPDKRLPHQDSQVSEVHTCTAHPSPTSTSIPYSPARLLLRTYQLPAYLPYLPAHSPGSVQSRRQRCRPKAVPPSPSPSPIHRKRPHEVTSSTSSCVCFKPPGATACRRNNMPMARPSIAPIIDYSTSHET